MAASFQGFIQSGEFSHGTLFASSLEPYDIKSYTYPTSRFVARYLLPLAICLQSGMKLALPHFTVQFCSLIGLRQSFEYISVLCMFFGHLNHIFFGVSVLESRKYNDIKWLALKYPYMIRLRCPKKISLPSIYSNFWREPIREPFWTSKILKIMTCGHNLSVIRVVFWTPAICQFSQ